MKPSRPSKQFVFTVIRTNSSYTAIHRLFSVSKKAVRSQQYVIFYILYVIFCLTSKNTDNAALRGGFTGGTVFRIRHAIGRGSSLVTQTNA